MNIYLTALLFILVIGVVTFPLFFSRIQRHELQKDQATPDTSESDALLSALSELEDDFQLGRLNKDEYQQQKIRLQRQYLKLKETPENG
jgi:flagellar basal body-associated protein FliL